MGRGEYDEDDSDFSFEFSDPHRYGASRCAFRLRGMEETLMLFFMLPAIIWSGMWSVMLEAGDISLWPQGDISLWPQNVINRRDHR